MIGLQKLSFLTHRSVVQSRIHGGSMSLLPSAWSPATTLPPQSSTTTTTTTRTVVTTSRAVSVRKLRGAPSKSGTAAATANGFFARSAAMRRRLRNESESYEKPSLALATSMPLTVQELDNQALVTLGAMGLEDARAEMLRRHIMVVEQCEYDDACTIFEAIAKKNLERAIWLSLPYQVGIATALTAGFGSIPLLFHLNTAKWFNIHFVTTSVPEPEDLETFLEVGSWTWNWMEPPLGGISFFLLCLQYSRAQWANLGLKPYTQYIKEWRGERLAAAFPRYDARLIMEYSESVDLYKKHHHS